FGSVMAVKPGASLAFLNGEGVSRAKLNAPSLVENRYPSSIVQSQLGHFMVGLLVFLDSRCRIVEGGDEESGVLVVDVVPGLDGTHLAAGYQLHNARRVLVCVGGVEHPVFAI